MKKAIAIKLKQAAYKVAVKYSNLNRAKNFNNETFDSYKIKHASEHSAFVIYKKNTGKYALAFFYYLDQGGGWWTYFFPKESHLVGVQKLPEIMGKIEQANFPKNFKPKEEER